MEPDERLDVAMFGPVVRAMGDEDLLHAEKLVLELKEHPGWVLVQEIIAKTVDVSTMNLRYASVKDHATMARDIGAQAGMESQKHVVNAILHFARKRQERIAEKVRRREGSAALAETEA